MRRGTHDTDIAELIEYIDPELFLDYEGVKFKRTYGSSGPQLNVKECPRCGGTSWKVYLNAETGLGNCFHGACVGEPGFNIFSFAMHLWSTRTRETVERLKQYALEQGWVAKRVTAKSVDMEAFDVELPESYELPINGKTLKYLADRGISAEISSYFNLRYCHKGVFIYYDQEGNRRWQNYDGRVIIPVFNLEGELVTFQGRDITNKREKKYLFPPGLAGTARFLYNGHNALGCEEVVIGEGAFDVMATKIAMDQDVALRRIGQIGTFGKHLSGGSQDGKDQLGAFIALKKLGLKRAVMMWDGECAAIKAAIEAAKLLQSVGIETRVALLPPNKDPNEVPAEVVIDAYHKALPPSSSKLMTELFRRSRLNS